MPYKLRRAGKGWKVENTQTHKTYSKKPIPKARAVRQFGYLKAAEKK